MHYVAGFWFMVSFNPAAAGMQLDLPANTIHEQDTGHCGIDVTAL